MDGTVPLYSLLWETAAAFPVQWPDLHDNDAWPTNSWSPPTQHPSATIDIVSLLRSSDWDEVFVNIEPEDMTAAKAHTEFCRHRPSRAPHPPPATDPPVPPSSVAIHIPPHNFSRARDPVTWSPSEASLRGISSYEVPGTVNGVPVNALPDWGSAVEAVSEDFARRHGLKIKATDIQSIRLLGGHSAESVGRIVGHFKFQGEKHVYRREFHVLRKSVYDLVLGKKFLDQTKTLTEYYHRIVERIRPCVQKGRRLFLLDESPKDRLRCAVNGAEASAFPDTGSELMLVSGDFVRSNKLEVRRGKEYRRRVELIDGSIIRTDGMVLSAELQFDAPPASSQELNYDQYLGFTAGLSSLTSHGGARARATFICDLHVIEDLPCDIILSNEFIFQNQVFSRFKSLFYSGPASTSPGDVTLADGLLFMRNKSTKPSRFSRWRRLPQSETDRTESSSSENRLEDMLTPLVPLQGGSSWEERWEIELARRNRAQLRIASLPEPQKSLEQRGENHRRAIWDRDNPRPPPATRFISSEPSQWRTQIPRVLPALPYSTEGSVPSINSLTSESQNGSHNLDLQETSRCGTGFERGHVGLDLGKSFS
ncbi:hypothetical protein DL771_000047 [Monosporascus sp. 5C6A]|nr:hypothetical protein DL771_000047 [Monosporascus sp. 5C6A]